MRILFLFMISFATSCQENPLGKKVNIGSNFSPGLDAPPKIQSLSPTQGTNIGGTNISIRGTGLKISSKVKIGGIDCAQITFVSSTNLICLTPALNLGLKDISIENLDGQKFTVSSAFTIIANIASLPGMGIYSGGKTSQGSTLKLHSTIGSPILEETMLGTTVQLKVGVNGIIFNP